MKQNGSGWQWHKIAQRVVAEYGAELGPGVFGVYYSLVCAADNETGKCFPSKVSLAQQWGISRRTVDAAIRKLEEHQPPLIRHAKRRGVRGHWGANDYVLLDPFADADLARASSSGSSMSKLNTEIVSAQNLRVDGAQNLRDPRAESAHGGGLPCADSAHGGEEWKAVRNKLEGRLPRQLLDVLDGAVIVVEPGGILIGSLRSDEVSWLSPYVEQMTAIGQRVTGVVRPVRLVNGVT